MRNLHHKAAAQFVSCMDANHMTYLNTSDRLVTDVTYGPIAAALRNAERDHHGNAPTLRLLFLMSLAILFDEKYLEHFHLLTVFSATF